MLAALLSTGCSVGGPPSRPDQSARAALHARAERLDRATGGSVYGWLVDHEPSRLDVARGSPDRPAAFDRAALVRPVGNDLRQACRVARHDRALLLAFVAVTSPERSLALDCGFALERDRTALVIAPR
jgi:hypothetical protein